MSKQKQLVKIEYYLEEYRKAHSEAQYLLPTGQPVDIMELLAIQETQKRNFAKAILKEVQS